MALAWVALAFTNLSSVSFPVTSAPARLSKQPSNLSSVTGYGRLAGGSAPPPMSPPVPRAPLVAAPPNSSRLSAAMRFTITLKSALVYVTFHYSHVLSTLSRSSHRSFSLGYLYVEIMALVAYMMRVALSIGIFARLACFCTSSSASMYCGFVSQSLCILRILS